MESEFSNTAGQKSAPLSKRRVKDSELDKNMRNTVSAGAPSTKGTKFIPYDESKAAPVKEVVKNTRPKNLVDKDITNINPVKKSTLHPNDVEGTNRVTPPVSTKTAAPAVTKTAAPAVTKTVAPTKTAAPVAKSRFERMRDAYNSFGKESDTAENQAIQKRIENYKLGGAVKASRGDGIAQRGKTRGRIC
jgi:hypothetical protein